MKHSECDSIYEFILLILAYRICLQMSWKLFRKILQINWVSRDYNWSFPYKFLHLTVNRLRKTRCKNVRWSLALHTEDSRDLSHVSIISEYSTENLQKFRKTYHRKGVRRKCDSHTVLLLVKNMKKSKRNSNKISLIRMIWRSAHNSTTFCVRVSTVSFFCEFGEKNLPDELWAFSIWTSHSAKFQWIFNATICLPWILVAVVVSRAQPLSIIFQNLTTPRK